VSRVVVVRDDGERKLWWNGSRFVPQRSEASITDLADRGPGTAVVIVGVRELAEGRVRVEPADPSPASWLDEARGWAEHRSEVSAAEDAGTADADDWAHSDDQAAVLVQGALSALEAVVDLDPCAWLDNAARFTCSEADAVARLLGLLSHDLAEAFLDAHAEGDSALEEDDPAHLARTKEK
jgi:hypothetical protein